MTPARSPLLRQSLAAAFLVLLAGCATTTPPAAPPPSEPVAVAPANEPEPTVKPEARTPREVAKPAQPPKTMPQPAKEPAPVEPAAEPVVAMLATQLHIPLESIEVLQVSRADWPNSCLGLPAEGEVCAMMITPGYAIRVAAAGQRYDFRTDTSGKRIRIASAPLAEPGKALATWRDSRSFAMLIVGTQKVAFGRRGRPLLVAPLGVPNRAKQLETFLARYAAFQAHTPAGDISLAGVGSEEATATEQRIVAEWARLVSAEAQQGLTEPLLDRAMVWRRTGGVAGFCDSVTVGRDGVAVASSCRNGEDRETARITLSQDDMAMLYGWIDATEPFSWTSDDGSVVADGMTIQLDFAGDGIDPASDSQRESMLGFMNRVVRRLFTASAGS